VFLQVRDGHGDVIGKAALLEFTNLPQVQQIAHAVSSGNVLIFEPSTLRTTYGQG